MLHTWFRPLRGVALLTCTLLQPALPCADRPRPAPERSGSDHLPAGAPELVARIRLEAPAVETFVLRATLPVPHRTWHGRERLTPYQVRDREGRLSPAQLEIVSRYAGPNDGADVVELLAHVRRPSGATPGTPIEFDVLHLPVPAEPFVAGPGIAALVQHGIELETRDVFGHVYSADLLRDLRDDTRDLRQRRSGICADQVRTHEVLVPRTPVGGASGTLAHHVAVHAYVTRWVGDSVVSLDLRIYNGGSGRDLSTPLDDPNRELYFDGLRLRIPLGWNVAAAFEDPFLGRPVEREGAWVFPLLESLPEGKLHVMPPQAQMVRRLVLYRDGAAQAALSSLQERNLGFCVDGWTSTGRRLASWWNPATGRYFTQKQPLPRLDFLDVAALRQKLDEGFEDLHRTLASGESDLWPFPIFSPVLGWAHPWGLGIGYAPGGDEIEFHTGADVAFVGSRTGYRTFQAAARMYNSRHATALYDAGGDATRLEDWLLPGGPDARWNPTWVWIKPVLWLGDPFGFNAAPSFQVDAVLQQGRTPPYQAALEKFQHIDDQHLGRYTRPLKVLAWLGNDALAKDDLLMQAEAVRLTYSDFPNSPNGDAIAIGMVHVRNDVDAYPGRGARIHRGTGWEIDTVVVAHALSDPDRREALEGWCDTLLDLVEKGQDRCTGVLGTNPNIDLFGGLHRVRQSISEAILENALWGMRQSVYGAHRPAQTARLGTILAASSRAMVSDLFWDPVQQRVHFYAATGPFSFAEPSYCEDVPPNTRLGHDNYQGWGTLAYGFRLTGDPVFLVRALAMAGGEIENVPNFGAGYLQNAAPVIALFQELGL